MILEDVVSALDKYGHVTLPTVFSSSGVSDIKQQVNDYINKCYPGIVCEEDGTTVRAVHGLHINEGFFNELCCRAGFLKIVERHLGDLCYVHQTKLNIKRHSLGKSWPWHEDFVFWNKKDGIELPKLLNVAIFLDDVVPENGPLCVIPGSHKEPNLIDITIDSSNWEQDVSNQLTYQISQEKVEKLTAKYGTEYILGKAGDVFIFDPLLAHSSSENTSQHNRSILIITYNAVSNPPKIARCELRPEFLCATDKKALSAVM